MHRIASLLLLCAMVGCGDDDDDGAAAADAAAGAAPDADPAAVADAAAAADADPAAPDGAPPSTADPGADGPFSVSEEDATIGSGQAAVQVTVFMPDGDGPFALVVISPGFQMERVQYASQAHVLATHGFVAVTQTFAGALIGGPTHQQLADQTAAVIAWAAGPDSGLAGKLLPGVVGVAGHSLGGKISFLTAATHAEAGIDAVVGWDPVDASSPSVTPELMAQVGVPVVVLGETTDAAGGFMPCAPAADNYQQYYAAAAAPAIEITVASADHMDWVDDPACPFCGFCTAGTAADAEVKALTRRTTVAAFRRYLLGELAMDAYLTGAVIATDPRASVVHK